MRVRLTPFAVLVAVVVMLMMLPVTQAATGDIALPTWPQNFEIPQGMTRTYAFPITKAGDVTVDLTWSGPALTVSLVDIEGKARSTVQNQPMPRAHLKFTLSAADVAKSNVYAIALAVPAPKPAATPPAATGPRRSAAQVKVPATPVASGNISLTAPPLDAAALQPKLKALAADRTAKFKALRAKGARMAKPKTSTGLIATRNAQTATTNASQRSTLLTQLNTKVAARTQALRTSTQTVVSAATKSAKLANARVAAARPSKGIRIAPPSSKYTKPTIVSGTPDATGHGASTGGGTGGGAAALTGFPGDEVVLQVGGIDPNAANTVTFTIRTVSNGVSATMNAQGTVYGAAVNGDVVNLTVGVPYAGDVRDPNASIVVRDPSANASAPFAFIYDPIPLPTVTGVRLADGVATPGHSLLVDGSGFGTGAQVFLKQIPGKGAAVAASASSAAAPTQSLLAAGIPNYTSESQFVAALYVAYHYKHKHFEADLQGADYPVTLDATSAALTSADRTSGTPGAAVLLGGTGFTSSGEVHCVIGAGKDLTAKIERWSDTAILFDIPDYQGMASPVTGTIYVKRPDGLKSNFLGFAFAPQMVHQHIDLSKYMVGPQWMFHAGNHLDKWELQDNGTRVWVHHETDFWNGSSGTDVAFWWSDGWPIVGAAAQPLAMYLKNGWTVSSIDWWQQAPNNALFSTSSYSAHADTNDPAVFVTWWIRIFIMAGADETFSFAIDIYGPKGTEYF